MALSADKTHRELSYESALDFEALFTEHWGRVYGVLFRLLGDHHDAEDLALEVFWRLYRRPPRADHPGMLVAWLYRVATNLGYNALRSGKRRTHYETQAGVASIEEKVIPDPVVEAERRLRRQQVHTVFAEMKPRSVNLLVLRHSGFAYKEIADILDVAPGSVGTLLARAEREFERRFSADYGQDQ